MTMRERLENALYDKASKEQEAFKEQLRRMSPDEVMQNAYQLVMQEDILMTFEEPDHLSDKEIKALLKMNGVLENCYNEWLSCDVSYMDGLRDTISDYAKGYAKMLDEQRKAKRKSEPER